MGNHPAYDTLDITQVRDYWEYMEGRAGGGLARGNDELTSVEDTGEQKDNKNKANSGDDEMEEDDKMEE